MIFNAAALIPETALEGKKSLLHEWQSMCNHLEVEVETYLVDLKKFWIILSSGGSVFNL